MDSSDDSRSSSPSKAEIQRITKGLEETVKKLFSESDDSDSITVNTIRTKAESALDLEVGFLKSDSFWRSESKRIIRDAVDKQSRNPSPEVEKDDGPKKAGRGRGQGGTRGRGRGGSRVGGRGGARGAARGKNADTTKKRIRVSEPVNDTIAASESLSALSEAEDEPPTKKKRARGKPKQRNGNDEDEPEEKAQVETPEPEISEPEITENNKTPQKQSPAGPQHDDAVPKPAADFSESEMSEVLDPTPKKRKRSSGKAEPKPKSKSNSKGASSKPRATKTAKGDASLDADAQKIKDLQGWLLKCGLRKLWGRELAKFSTPKEKINHLKGLLADVGMTGRLSNEKAKRIKEERELAADLAAVQEGAKVWGADGGDTGKTRSARAAEASSKPRKLVRCAELAYFDEDSE